MQENEATIAKAHERNLGALIEDHENTLRKYFGTRCEQVLAAWYNQERERFEYPEGVQAGPAAVLDFVPILTRRAVEERVHRWLAEREQAYQGAA
jgi:hypothetical protein